VQFKRTVEGSSREQLRAVQRQVELQLRRSQFELDQEEELAQLSPEEFQ
jgi:hypothetical protein